MCMAIIRSRILSATSAPSRLSTPFNEQVGDAHTVDLIEGVKFFAAPDYRGDDLLLLSKRLTNFTSTPTIFATSVMRTISRHLRFLRHQPDRPSLRRGRAQRSEAVTEEAKMPRKYLRITEVTKICGVDVKFVKRLEQEQVIFRSSGAAKNFIPSIKSTACASPACSSKRWA